MNPRRVCPQGYVTGPELWRRPGLFEAAPSLQNAPPGSLGSINSWQALRGTMMRYTLKLFVQPLCLVECARGLLFHRHRRIETVLRERHAECTCVLFGEEK
jgi:hypothetical protein